jgi:hypothetical protein
VQHTLELASTEDLIAELEKRYTALVVYGAHSEDPETTTELLSGCIFMCCGLIKQADHDITAMMTRGVDEEQ